MTFTGGIYLGAPLVCISVCAVADDLPTSNETGPAAVGVCSIGILMCVRCVNVFIAVVELCEGFETAKRLPCVGLLELLYTASSARGVWEVPKK